MKQQIFISRNSLKTILFCFLISCVSSAFGKDSQLPKSLLLNKPVSDNQTPESANPPAPLSHQISESSGSNDSLSIYPDDREKPMITSKQKNFKREAALFNGKAGLGYSLLMTYVASFLLEFETPFIKEQKNLRWLVQAGGGTAFSSQLLDPYFSAHTGLKYDFGNLSTSFTMGLFYSDLLKYQPVGVFSLGFSLFSNETLLELNMGVLRKFAPLPVYFILSLSIPLRIL